jgi:hypothetical protein
MHGYVHSGQPQRDYGGKNFWRRKHAPSAQQFAGPRYHGFQKISGAVWGLVGAGSPAPAEKAELPETIVYEQSRHVDNEPLLMETYLRVKNQ